jgi:hypothetical protein
MALFVRGISTSLPKLEVISAAGVAVAGNLRRRVRNAAVRRCRRIFADTANAPPASFVAKARPSIPQCLLLFGKNDNCGGAEYRKSTWYGSRWLGSTRFETGYVVDEPYTLVLTVHVVCCERREIHTQILPRQQTVVGRAVQQRRQPDRRTTHSYFTGTGIDYFAL